MTKPMLPNFREGVRRPGWLDALGNAGGSRCDLGSRSKVSRNTVICSAETKIQRQKYSAGRPMRVIHRRHTRSHRVLRSRTIAADAFRACSGTVFDAFPSVAPTGTNFIRGV